MPLSIGYVTPEYTHTHPTGGLAVYLSKIARLLTGAGHDVRIVAPGTQGRLHIDGVEVLQTPEPAKKRLPIVGQALCDLELARRLTAVAREAHAKRPFDLIQYASWRSVGALPLVGVPSIGRISSLSALCDEAAGRRTPTAKVGQALELVALRRMDRLVGPSRLINGIVSGRIGKEILHLPTPFEPFAGAEDDGLVRGFEGRPFLFFFGKLSRVKGADRLGAIARAALLADDDLLLVAAGEVLDAAVPTAIAADLGALADRFVLLPPQPHARLMPLVRAAAAVLLPSRVDNFPNAGLEALACGAIVIASEGASFEDMITEGEDGFLCSQTDDRDWHRVIADVLSWSPERRRAAREAARRAAARYSPQVSLAAHIALYEEARVSRSEGP